MKKLLFILTFFLVTFSSKAQEPEMADTMRSEGKIYVVVSIVLIILFGLIIYLFTIDKKLKKLEGQK